MTPVWNTSVDEMISIFRAALTALVPVIERAHMHWREPYAYDDWDSICETIYDSIVVSSIKNALAEKNIRPIVKYDQRIQSYKDVSYISCSNEKYAPFICFETTITPFDTVVFATLDEAGDTISIGRASATRNEFTFVARASGILKTYNDLSVRL